MKRFKRSLAMLICVLTVAFACGVGVYTALAADELTPSDFNVSALKLVDSNGVEVTPGRELNYLSGYTYVWESQSKDGVQYNGKTITITAPEHWEFDSETEGFREIRDAATGEKIASIETTKNTFKITYLTDLPFKQKLNLGIITDRKDPYWNDVDKTPKTSNVAIKPLYEGKDFEVTVKYDKKKQESHAIKRPISYKEDTKKMSFVVDIETDIYKNNAPEGEPVKRSEMILFDTPQRGMKVGDLDNMRIYELTATGGYGKELYPKSPKVVEAGKLREAYHPARVELENGMVIEAYRIFYDVDEKGYAIYEDAKVELKDPDTAKMFESAEVTRVPKGLRIEPLSNETKPDETSGIMYRIINNTYSNLRFWGEFSVFDEKWATGVDEHETPTLNNKSSYYAQDLTNCDDTGKCSKVIVEKDGKPGSADVSMTSSSIQGELIYDARVKVKKVDDTGKSVEGAKFTISRYKSGVPVKDSEKKEVTNLVSNKDGMLERVNPDGTRTPLENILLPRTELYLFENEAPAHYEKLAEPVKLTVQKADTPADAASHTVTNPYKPDPTTLTGEGALKASKVLNGRDFKETDSFEFVLAAKDGAPMPAAGGEKVTTNNGDLKNFGDITYTKAGTYKYTVTETKGSAAGITYDATPKEITVTVTDNNGVLSAVPTYPDNGQSAVFTNTYAPQPLTLTGESALKAKKILNGRDFKDGDSFTFTLTPEGENAPTIAKNGETVTVTNGDPKSFGDITFTQAGTYTLSVSETKGSLPGVTYDAQKKTVTVVVTDDGNGALTSKVTYPDGKTAVEFTNTYAPTGTTLTGENALKASKVLNGRDFKETDSFEFVLAAKDGAPMPAAGGEKITVNNGDPKSFGDIAYTKAGTYKYTVTETKGSAAGVTYDATPKEITVTVTDNNGALSASVTYPDKGKSAVFTNTYAPQSLTLTGENALKAQKKLNGRDFKEGDSFEFVLSPKTDGAPMPQGTGNKVTVSNGDAQAFGDITFTKAGVYEYNVAETKGSAGGMTYDTTTKVVTVMVTDNGAATLSAKVAYPDNTLAATFTNTYATTPAELSGDKAIKVQKTLNGRDFKEGDSFEFVLAAKDGAPMPAAGGEKVTVNNGDPKSFGAITYVQPGTYYYNVTETKGNAGGVTYDVAVRQVEVTVADNGSGALVPTVSYGEGETIAAFTNTYVAQPTTISGESGIQAKKLLNGRDFKETDSFEFVLAAKDGAPMPAAGGEKITVNNGDPKSFGDITFTKAGTYTYTVTETKGSAAGVTYDAAPKEVTVTVVDASGSLSATVLYPEEGKTAVEFTNTYAPNGTTLSGENALKASKVLNGRDFAETDSFEFVLAAKDGAPMPAAGGEKITVNNGDPKSFGDITFTKAGTYTYTVTETKGSAAGVTYDAAPKEVTVTVTDNNGTLSASVAYPENAQSAVFTNTYETSSATLSGENGLKVKKTLTGRDFKETDSFEFVLAAKDGAPMPAAGGERVTVSNGDPKAFGDITFNKAGEYHYTVTETKGSAAGVTYDGSTKDITVTVTDNGAGALVAAVSYGEDSKKAAEFTNTYKAQPVTITGNNAIKASKTLEGRDFKADDSFEFVLAAKDNAPMPAAGGEKITVNSKDAKSFGAITFDKAGTFKYTVTETKGSAAGVTYDSKSHEVAVTVTDNGEGALEAVVSYGEEGKVSAELTNTYKASQVALDGASGIQVKKKLVGRDWKDGDTFTFTLTPKDGAPAFSKSEVLVTNAAAANFGTATFDKAGTYTYEIAETAGNVSGITYDSTKITATVTVVDNGEGKLAASVAYSTGSAEAEFVNTYAAGPATISGDTGIKASKTLEGRDFKADDSFEFVLAAKDNAPMPSAGGEKITINSKDAKSFGAISYDKAGTFKYTVTETKGSAAGVTYDSKSYEVTVTVTDDGNGALKASVSYGAEDKSSVEVTNTYAPSSVTVTGDSDAALKAQKTLNGRDWKDGDSFEFVVAPQNGAPAPAQTSVTVTNNKPVSFGDITFDKAGEYTYKISEVKGNLAGITYDTNEIIATVTVSDDTNGKLVASTKYSTGAQQAEFTNTYGAGPATITGDNAIKASKKLTGRDFKAGDSFEFVLAAKDNAPMPAAGGEKITVNNAEPKSFGALTFDKAGTFKYTVTETKGSAAGVTYDSKSHEVTVTVTDNGQGALGAVVSYDTEGKTSVEFTNSYAPSSVTVTGDSDAALKAQKTLNGRDWKDGDSFEFVVAPQNGAPAPAQTSVTATNNKPVSFGDITFDKAGEYTYKISEVKGNIAGITYDTKEVTATVTVTDDTNGKLVASTKYSTGAAQAEFVNTYGTSAVSISGDNAIKASKKLTGRDFKADDSFEFVLAAKDGAPMPAAGGEKITVNNAEPKSFGALTFDKAGTFKYTVTETKGSAAGVTYDSSEKTVTVTVTDNGDGTLSAQVAYPAGSSAEFTNTYAPSSVTVTGDSDAALKAQKTLNGRDFKETDSFEFVVEPQNGAPAPAQTSASVKNATAVSFGDITFDKAGEYTYKITEKAGNIAGITYDTKEVTATVTVTDDTNGKLVASTKYSTGAAQAEFVNTYAAGPANVSGDKGIQVTKKLTGRDFKPGDSFEFVLSAQSDGAPMPAAGGEKITVTDGTAQSFGAIIFSKAGTYTYEVKETAGNIPGVSYDTSTKEVTVEVTDAGDGVLSASVSGSAEFTNTYAPSSVTVTGDSDAALKAQKTLNGRDWKDGDSFEFVVAPQNGAPAPAQTSVSVKNATAVNFGDITFDKAGEYTYKISEVKGNIAGITYDTKEVTATVTVTDDTNGKLVASTKYSTGAAQAEFVNTYAAGPVTVTGDSGIKVKKTLEGREFKTDDAFEFVLSAKDGAPMPSAGGEKIVVNSADTKSFGAIAFAQTGTYTYEVKESAGTAPGVTYDTSTKEVIVEVTDSGDGLLKATVSDVAEFTNVYKPTPLTVTGDSDAALKAQKTLNGRDWKDGDSFEFVVAPQNGAPAPAQTSVTATNNKPVSFGDITFDKAGEYTYKISEVKGSIENVTYDEGTVIATITVTDDMLGKLSAKVSYSNDAPYAEFVNVYAEKPQTPTTPGSGNPPVDNNPAITTTPLHGSTAYKPALKIRNPLPKTADESSVVAGVVGLAGVVGISTGLYRRKTSR